MSIAVSKVGVVPCRASSEKSKDSVGRISISTNVSCYQTRYRRLYVLPVQTNKKTTQLLQARNSIL